MASSMSALAAPPAVCAVQLDHGGKSSGGHKRQADPQRLMEVALAIVRRKTGSELLREIDTST